MKYQAPFGSTDPNAPYVDRDTPGAVRGSAVPGLAIEDPQRELHDLIEKSGLTPTEAELQLAKAVQSGKVNYVVAGGTANALTATLSPALSASDYRAGLALHVLIATTNTGATTFNGKAVVDEAGAALVGGELVAGNIVRMLYDGVKFRLPGVVKKGLLLYATPGTFSWVCPAGVTQVLAKVWGGGGAGGSTSSVANSASASGGGGGYSEGLVAVVPGLSYAVVVGAGGVAASGTVEPAIPSASTGGGTSSFAGVLSATGGGAGLASAGGIQTVVPAGGVGSGGTLRFSGGSGGSAYPAGTGVVVPPGGYAYAVPAQLYGAVSALFNGRTGLVPGGGGGGAYRGGAGGAGGAGCVILQY